MSSAGEVNIAISEYSVFVISSLSTATGEGDYHMGPLQLLGTSRNFIRHDVTASSVGEPTSEVTKEMSPVM